MTQRQNNNLGLTENFYYDDLYRLSYSQLNGVTNLSLGYDAMGNITSRSDVAGGAAWTYNPAHKHQVTQAGNSNYTYSYDSNGNAVTRNGNNITWSKYNYPTVINGNGETANLFYDANQARWKQAYVKGSVTETTIYAGGGLQKVSVTGQPDDYRYQISANGQAVAIMSRLSNGTNSTRYLLRDGLGSVAKITDSSGAEVVSESYSAFGTRRNPSTWSGVPTNGDQVASNGVTREGYTGQDALGGLGLNHMNGRVQDAITGRFLSADPYITEPGNTQNYNRYSYVYNNPLSATDPSGFDTGSIIRGHSGYFLSCSGNCLESGSRSGSQDRTTYSYTYGDGVWYEERSPYEGPIHWDTAPLTISRGAGPPLRREPLEKGEMVPRSPDPVSADPTTNLADAPQETNCPAPTNNASTIAVPVAGAGGAGESAFARLLARLGGAFFSLATLVSAGDTGQPHTPIFRAVEPGELASIQATGRYLPSPSGYGEKQFWQSLQSAQSYVSRLPSSWGPQTIVTSSVTAPTYAMGSERILDQMPAISFPISALGPVNRDAANSGGIRVVQTCGGGK